MPYDNEYNRMVADDVMRLNKKYMEHEKITGQGMSGGFLGALAGMILPQIVGAVANKVLGNGRACECPDDVAECECGDAHQAGEGVSGGSGFASGTMMDTGFDRTIGAGVSAGVRRYKKKSMAGCGSTGAGSTGGASCCGTGASGGRKKGKGSTGAGSTGAGASGGRKKGSGIISSLGIPLISNVAGMFGLGSTGAGSTGAGASGGAMDHTMTLTKGDMTFLKKIRTRLEKGMKPTKAQTKKILDLHGAGKMTGGFLPALLGAVAMPIISKILGGGMSGGTELGPPGAQSAGEGSTGAGASGGKRRGRKSKMGSGYSAAGSTGAGVSGGRSLVPVANMKASYMAGQGRSGGAKGDRWTIVKKVMKDKGLKMIEASKYVKEHNLY
jgi:hypothetical protein